MDQGERTHAVQLGRVLGTFEGSSEELGALLAPRGHDEDMLGHDDAASKHLLCAEEVARLQALGNDELVVSEPESDDRAVPS